MKGKITTKFGTAKINSNGYYEITTRNEGNNGKSLHKLIFEDFYNVKVPEGFVVHHKDNNPLNNCILNLQMLSRSNHNSIHKSGENCHFYGKHFFGEKNGMYGKTHSLESCIKMSKSSLNKSGYFRVFKHKNSRLKQGFTWKYCWYDENHKRRELSSTDLDKLKEKVIAKGLAWVPLNEGELIESKCQTL